METIKIVLADDHKLIRDGIKTLLKMDEAFEVIGEANDGEHLMEVLETCKPHLVLLDISMPKINGIDAISKIKKKCTELKFIVLTMHDEGDYVRKAMDCGAQGYLLKNSDFEELQKAIKTVAGGGKYYNSVISHLFTDNLSTEEIRAARPDLTPREIEILREVTDGLSTKLIAEKYSISSRTVETHRVNMMRKMNAHNTAELIKKALAWKLIG